MYANHVVEGDEWAICAQNQRRLGQTMIQDFSIDKKSYILIDSDNFDVVREEGIAENDATNTAWGTPQKGMGER